MGQHHDLSKEIDAKRTPGAMLERAKKARGFPKELRLYLEEKRGHANYTELQRARQAAEESGAEEWRSLSPKKRRKLLEVLFPTLVDPLEAALALHVRRTYTLGHARRPFRCPGSETQIARMQVLTLLDCIDVLGDVDADLDWMVDRAQYFQPITWLLAGVLEAKDSAADALLARIEAIAAGEAGVLGLHRAHIAACQIADNPKAWDFVQRLLMAAARQEGLRQTILETADEGHPLAFVRMLDTILEANLTRFSSVVRAAGVWFGFGWEDEKKASVDALLGRARELLADDDARLEAIGSESAEEVFLGLWSTATEDVDVAVERAALVLQRADPAHRYVAVHFLDEVGWSSAAPRLQAALADPELAVVWRALASGEWLQHRRPDEDAPERLELLEGLRARFGPKAKSLRAERPAWSPGPLVIDRADVVERMIPLVPTDEVERLVALASEATPDGRASVLRRVTGILPDWGWTEDGRWGRLRSEARRLDGHALEFTYLALGDAAEAVRAIAFRALEATPVMAEEVDRHVELLRRKASDLRTGALERLAQLPDAALVDVVDRLTNEGVKERRLAGLELARSAVESGRAVEPLAAVAAAYRERRRKIGETEEAHLAVLENGAQEEISLDDALGLIDPASWLPWPRPEAADAPEHTAASQACIESLAGVLADSLEALLEAGAVDEGYSGLYRTLYTLGSYDGRAPEEVWHVDVWRAWEASRGPELRDPDGLELVRALLLEHAPEALGPNFARLEAFRSARRWLDPTRYLRGILALAIQFSAQNGEQAGALALAAARVVAAVLAFDEDELDHITARPERGEKVAYGWSTYGRTLPPHEVKEETLGDALELYATLRRCAPGDAPERAEERLHAAIAYLHDRVRGCSRVHVRFDLFRRAVEADAFGEHDAIAEFLKYALGPDTAYSGRTDFLRNSLPNTRRGPNAPEDPLRDHTDLRAVRGAAIRRIVDVELGRGDLPTPATPFVHGLGNLGGVGVLSRAVDGLGNMGFQRLATYMRDQSKKQTLSHIVRQTRPKDGEDDAFLAWAKDVPEKRLVELAAYAPAWAPLIERALRWKGFEDAIWWFRAHTKDGEWGGAGDREMFAAEVAERTPLTAADLEDGAVDVDWFQRARKALGPKRWAVMLDAAKYASSSGGHKRATLFADVLGGTTKLAEVKKRVDDKRHQDSVRALGLVPLRRGQLRRKDILARYERLAAFRKESRQFGSQRQESEKRAVAIGLQNLARTAGYRDPQRMIWALERDAVADLVDGPVTIERDDVAVTLEVTEEGDPLLTVARAGKRLKNVPKSHAKDPGFAALKARAKDLRTQASRVRDTLETAMVAGDLFEARELAELLAHPILAPRFRALVWTSDDGARMGYPDAEASTLSGPGGVSHGLGPEDEVRIAHPTDLFASGSWAAWQRDCFEARRTQPIKQVFRELYPLTESERGEAKSTARYAGHQLQPRQALAVLGGRGWVFRPEEGVSKTFHDADLVARLGFEEHFYTPADVEGLTLDKLEFTRRSKWERLALETLEPRLVSEVLRDLDLAVSVAHQGGVDPEASASTIEMRAALLGEVARMLKLDNVEVKEKIALIRGTRATYGLHLGSAEVRVVGSIALHIVAVHSQHRGRLFLPFADDDPRTAEVMSKALMLARDDKIQDPNLLEQIAMS